ncbi:MAG TPA: LPS export ABC transporter permease LptF [Candidatus Acidoferrum sp.]|jgi:LPS export ABC transporter permease LptF/LPS export ABC transporter permease LptG
MRILDRYIVREVLRHALLGLLIFTFVLFVPKLVRLMELFVRHSGSGSQIALLFLCIIPSVLVFTLPMAVLVGVLLGLGRMSMDSEIIALTALGISRKRILFPVGVIAVLGAALTLAMTIWVAPKSLRTLRDIEGSLITSQISFQVMPRVFDERFPHLVLYINDVLASGTHWNGVFLAEAGAESGSRITLAESAIVIADPQQGKLELHLNGGSTHEMTRQDPNNYSVTAFGRSDWPIEVIGMDNAKERELSNPEKSLSQLWHDRGKGWRDARVELNQRFAFPIACFVFALIAVPLGTQPRRGGRAAGTLLAVLVIGAYYLLFIMGAGLARQGVVPPWIGMWVANVILALMGFALLPRMERYRGESQSHGYIARLLVLWRLFRRRRKAKSISRAANPASTVSRPELNLQREENGNGTRAEIGPSSASSVHTIIDLYLLRRFFYNFVMVMAVFILLFQTFTFFELLDDIARHHIPFFVVINYFRYLIPYLLYQLTPLGALVAVLVTFGVMAKNNEIIAFKASGISLYRLAVPILISGAVLAGALFVLDSTYLPYANQRQDALRNQIKGKPPQTYTRPQRWIFGESSKVYNYDLFDSTQNLFGGLTVIELDPGTFEMRRRVFATRARWLMPEKTWVLESGWVRDFDSGQVTRYAPFTVTTLPELVEAPSYFNREVIQAIQMNLFDLDRYIAGLQNAGFEVSPLRVQWHKKLAYPLIAPISMLLAIPFALLVGNRGAVSGIAIGVGIGIAYWAISALLEAMGGIGQLPPTLAGWAPDIIFFFFGLYFFFKMPT